MPEAGEVHARGGRCGPFTVWAWTGRSLKTTARLLGISRNALKARIDKYGLSAVA